MLRVVVDVNVLVSAVLSRTSSPGRIVEEWRAGVFELVVSPRLLDELRSVLARPHIERRVSSAADAAALVDRLSAYGAMVDDPPDRERLVPDDPGDDYLVALARASRAYAIVTGDRHLHDAARPPLILSPTDFIAWLERLDL